MTELDDLRYPIGRFSPPASNAPDIRAAHIQTLRLLPERLSAAVAGLNDAQLDTPYREDGWTVRQVVHHLADSHAKPTSAQAGADRRLADRSSPMTRPPGQSCPTAGCPSMVRWR